MVRTLEEYYLRSHSQNHDFSGFNERSGAFSRLEPHFFGGVRGNDGGDVLFADGHGHLSQQAAIFNRQHAPDELIASADLAEVSAAVLDVSALEIFRYQAIDFTLGHAMMTAGGLRGLNLVAVDPLLQRGVAYSQDVGGFPRRQKSLHDYTSDAGSRIDGLEPQDQYVLIRFLQPRGCLTFAVNFAKACQFSECGRCAPGFSFHRT